MNTLIRRMAKEGARYYYFVEAQLPHRYLFSRQQTKLFGALSYLDVLSFIHTRHGFNRYLEIGVDTGVSLSLSRAKWNYGVDPAFSVQCPLDGNYELLKTTSDKFFAEYAGEPFDFVFVDGLHVAAQVSNDLFNSLRNLAPNGLIAVHDTVPFNRIVASPRRYTTAWTGDVYRALVPYIERCSESILTLLVPPSGLTLLKHPRRFLEGMHSPLRPSDLTYDECMRVILRTSAKANDIPTLERLLSGFYSS